MNTLLWMLAIVGGINTLSIMYGYFMLGYLPPMTNTARFIDAIYTAAFAVWAIVLLMGQK